MAAVDELCCRSGVAAVVRAAVVVFLLLLAVELNTSPVSVCLADDRFGLLLVAGVARPPAGFCSSVALFSVAVPGVDDAALAVALPAQELLAVGAASFEDGSCSASVASSEFCSWFDASGPPPGAPRTGEEKCCSCRMNSSSSLSFPSSRMLVSSAPLRGLLSLPPAYQRE